MQYVLGMLDGVDARAKLIGILPTMYEPRRLLSGDQLAELLKLGNVLPPIPRSVVASEAVLAGRSIVAYAPVARIGRVSGASRSHPAGSFLSALPRILSEPRR